MLGLKLKGGRTQCPVCKGDPRSLAITPGKGFFCFKAHKGGSDTIALVAHIKECGMREAAEIIDHHFPTNSPVPRGAEKEDEPVGDTDDLKSRLAELEERVTALENKNVVSFKRA